MQFIPPSLPNPCVDVPIIENVVHSREHDKQWKVETHTVPELDIDGHGSAVVLVPPENADLYPDTMYWTLYLMRGECGHDLGIINGLSDPILQEGESHGLRNISTLQPTFPASSDLPRGNLKFTLYTFNGKSYRPQRPRRR